MIEAEKANVASVENITGVDAAKVICSSKYEDVKTLGFDATEASRLGLKQGEVVSVVPADTGVVHFLLMETTLAYRHSYQAKYLLLVRYWHLTRWSALLR